MAAHDNGGHHNPTRRNDRRRRRQSTTSIHPPDLPWGDINVVIVTDVHSWIGGHSRHASSLLNRSNFRNDHDENDASNASTALLNADYGHVLSFYQHLQDFASSSPPNNNESKKKNLFFVMNGDFIDGTGLTEFPPIHLTNILQDSMPWDAINIGNHELYRNSTIEHLRHMLLDEEEEDSSTFTFSWKHRYVTSNVMHTDTQRPLGNRFIYLQGPSARVLTFGFLYNFQGGTAATVEQVEQVVQSDWFINVLTVHHQTNNNNNHNSNNNNSNNNKSHNYQDFDAILVLAHMGYNDSLIVNVLLPAMRNLVGPDMPIQFVTGHTHVRAFTVLDDMSTSLEAGHFLDTIGFCSFPRMKRKPRRQRRRRQLESTFATNHLFRHVLLDANQETLRSILQVPQLDTPDGKALSARIRQTQQDLGLLRPIGCAPMTYYLGYGLDHAQSLWRLYITQVIIPSATLYNWNSYATMDAAPPRRVFVQATDGLRFDLFQGQVLVDDAIAVSPFQDAIYQVMENIRGDLLLEILEGKAATVHANETMVTKHDDTTTSTALPEYAFAMSGPDYPSIEAHRLYQLMTVELDLGYLVRRVESVMGTTPTPKPVVGPDGQQIVTSTQLWLDFVETKWSTTAGNCHAVTATENQPTDHLETGSKSWYLFAMVGIAVTFVVFFVVRKGHSAIRRSAQGYKPASVTMEHEGGGAGAFNEGGSELELSM